MGVHKTVVFTDLFGSTGAFEALGNVTATQAVTHVTAWIADVIESHGGRVVKMLGDGVLALFADNGSAITAMVDVQRLHDKHMARLPASKRMPIRIGIASGDVEIVAGDCYGDAVNVAARLSGLSGPDEIWANNSALIDVEPGDGMRFRLLGLINIRGRTEPCTVYQVEWQEGVSTGFLTKQADISISQEDDSDSDALGGEIQLTCMDISKTFRSFEMPVQIGRIRDVEFVVSDPRVSRTHARIEWRNGSIFLVDVSSYGSWVRFSGGGSDLLLRREECVLHGHGVIALGSSFSDLSAPTVNFDVS